MYHNFEKSRIIVFGCGNVLFGDDGFGPELIKYLEKNYRFNNVTFVDAGTSIRDILFNLSLIETENLKKIIVIDIADINRKPGEYIKIDIEEFPKKDIKTFSMHQAPTSSLLHEIKNQKNIDVKLILIQPYEIPEEVAPGISDILKKKIPKISEAVINEIKY